jgi:phosphohistidine phosphatase
MLRLMLLRHAKSSRDDPTVIDIDRPLAARGWRDAKAMGCHVARHDLIPARVLCSPAQRARQTWDQVSSASKMQIEPDIEPAIYDFGDGAALLDVVRVKGGIANPLMLVGHNPSMEGLAQMLIGSGDSTLRVRLEEKYPTCALAIISFEAEAWKDINDGQGRLYNFVRPKDLA